MGPQHPHSRDPWVASLSQKELAEADAFVQHANQTLKWDLSWLTPAAAELLQRNYWIIKKGWSIYAFWEFVDPSLEHVPGDYMRLKGGTGWAVQMGMDWGMGAKSVYVYNMLDHWWYEQKWQLALPPLKRAYKFFQAMVGRCYPSLNKFSIVMCSLQIDTKTQNEIHELFSRSNDSASVHFVPNCQFCQSGTHHKEYLDDD